MVDATEKMSASSLGTEISVRQENFTKNGWDAIMPYADHV